MDFKKKGTSPEDTKVNKDWRKRVGGNPPVHLLARRGRVGEKEVTKNPGFFRNGKANRGTPEGGDLLKKVYPTRPSVLKKIICH